MDPVYRDIILDHYKNPRNFGSLKNYDSKSEKHNPFCGDTISIEVKYRKRNNTIFIEDISFSGQGCAISIASTSLLTSFVKGKSLNVLRKISKDDIVNLFFWTILGLLIGARILATTLYDSTHYYITKPWLIFWPFREGFKFTGLQGMSYHGGVIGAFVAAIIYCRVKKQSFLQ